MTEPKVANLFLALVMAQAAHSVEEYFFRLYEVFAPARFVSGAFGDDLALGFAIANAALVAFGVWCYLARVRPGRGAARPLAWFWGVLETANGTGHLLLAAAARGYFPGAATAPLLLACGACLLTALVRAPRPGLSA